MVSLSLTACAMSAPLIPTPTVAPTPAPVAPVTVACSESLAPALRGAAAAFRRDRAELEVVVLSLADALVYQALQQEDAEVAVVTWLSDAAPDGAWMQPVSRDGLAIVVNPQNGLAGLTMTQLQDLFQGRLEDWAMWGGLPGAPSLVSRETASGDSAFFQAWVMRDARITLNALLAPSSDAALQFVADDPLAVGYVSTAWLDGRVRALVINDVPPVRETIAAGLYPLTRTHFVVMRSEPDGPSREFVQWLLAAPGQAVLEAYGFVAAP
ncbi:MAG: substrate-binding domain-containing protein [Anaerolineae bacterium]|nr:substrate-binding domain-containing protein [Anaerolineae bacterium]